MGPSTSHSYFKGCETGPPAYSSYPRRLESLTICWCNYKGSTFYSVIQRPWVLVRPESNSRPPALQPNAQPTEPPVRGSTKRQKKKKLMTASKGQKIRYFFSLTCSLNIPACSASSDFSINFTTSSTDHVLRGDVESTVGELASAKRTVQHIQQIVPICSVRKKQIIPFIMLLFHNSSISIHYVTISQ